MTNRQRLLSAIFKLTFATTEELADHIPEFTRQKLRDTLGDCVKSGLILREKDDVTGLPAYRLSDAGKKQHDSSVTQAVSGDVTAAATDRPTCVAGGCERTDPPAEAVAVIEPPKPDDSPVAAGSDEVQRLEGEMRFILGSIRKALCIAHDDSIGIVPTIEALIESNDIHRASIDELVRELSNVRLDAEKDYQDMRRFQAKYIEATHEVERLTEELATANAANSELADENTDLRRNWLFEDHSEQPRDMVNHPPHYQGKVECIDAIESALGPDGFTAYCRGNAIKYTFRAGRKGDAAEDLAKAAWYLQRAGQ